MAEVSIVVTAYNIEAYIDQCLRSVASQTLGDIEVIVVDDGSSDATPRLIAEFCALDARFVPVLLQVNSPGGVGTAANAGLDRATGTWVGFVDGDDYVEPTMFDRLLRAATTYAADLAMCDYREVVDGTDVQRDPADAHRWSELTEPCYRLDVHTREQFLRFIAVPWRKLYRRRLLEDNRIRFPVGEAFYEDNPFHWFAVLSAEAIAVVPEVLCYHRVGRGGQTMATTDARAFQIFSHHETIRSWLADRGMLDLYQASLVTWVISQMEWISRRTPPALRRQLFDTLVPILRGYSRDTLNAALRLGSKGTTARRLSIAVARGDYRAFERVLSDRPASENPLSTGIYHLRHSGPRHTAVLTGRYLSNLLRDSKVLKRLGRTGLGGPNSREAVALFGLTVIQRDLRRIDGRLAEIGERLARLEGRLDGVPGDTSASAAVVEDSPRRDQE